MIKRILLLVLAVMMLAGCSSKKINNDVLFYYPNKEYSYNSSDGAITSEGRTNRGISSATDLLNVYVKGPQNELLQNPFPDDLTVISVYTLENTVYITVSDALAELSGAPLILACACISRTAMDIAGTTSAQIQCENLLLDGKQFITINDETVFYSDTFHQAKPEVS